MFWQIIQAVIGYVWLFGVLVFLWLIWRNSTRQNAAAMKSAAAAEKAAAAANRLAAMLEKRLG